jgi:TonB family protein
LGFSRGSIHPRIDHLTLMPSVSQTTPFAMLPETRPPWKEFLFSMVTQGGAVALLLWIGVLHPQILKPPVHDYQEISLVTTPPPVNHEPAPVRDFKVPMPRIVQPNPEALRTPTPVPRTKTAPDQEAPAPKVEMAESKPDLPAATPVIPKRLVQTNVFSTGSSATPTMAKAPQQVQTGGFGDPNGVPAKETNSIKPANIAQLGSFDLPAGPGYGNGTGGAKGAKGVVASAGFGNGVAIGDGSGTVNASRGNEAVRTAGFGDADAKPAAVSRPKATESTPRITPAEILSKPTPAYTEEARRLKVEGEVLLEVTLQADGKVKVLRVVRGLGHGLDESAIRAAEQISFKPAMRDGQPADSNAVLHIIFQLA